MINRLFIISMFIIIALFIISNEIRQHGIKEMENRRFNRIISEVKNVAVKTQKEANQIEHPESFTILRNDNGDVIYYKNIAIERFGMAEIGIYCQHKYDPNITLYYGVDMPTSNMYVISKDYTFSKKIKNPFKYHMTHIELLNYLNDLSDELYE